MTFVSSAIIAGSVNAAPIPFTRDLQLEQEIVETYSGIAYANYQDSLQGVSDLKQAINDFLVGAENNFSERSLELLLKNAKDVWTSNARVPYGQTEIFRFVNGPIDFEAIDDGVTSYLEQINFEGVEGMVNGWPLDEAYIDAVDGDPQAGIVNNTALPITKDLLTSMNEQNGEKNISTGYHAVEFLLWGQDFSATGAGERPASDYTTAPNADRRRLYLKTLVEILDDHISSVTAQWEPNQNNYRASLKSLDSGATLQNMFVSMISMIGDELKSERVENALLLEDQEEEHSCFSDTTVNDIMGNYLGAKNIYLGQYQAYNNASANYTGKGISAYVATFYPDLDQKIKAQFTATENAIAYFYATTAKNLNFGYQSIAISFDNAIVDEQAKVQAIIDELDALDGLLKQAAKDLGYQI